MKKHPILFGILILLAVVYISNIVSMRRAPIPVTQPAQATARQAKSTEEWTVDLARNLLANYMPSATVESRFDKENNWAFIDIIQNDMDGDFVRQAKSGAADYITAWNGIVKNAVEIQKDLQKIFRTMNMEDTVVVLDILNADNTDEVLLSVANGIVGYDVVNEIDLLNQ